MQVNVSRFAYLFVWLSLLFRPVIIVLLWKASREFRRIVRQKQSGESHAASAGAHQDTKDLELARIMAQYGMG